MIQQKEDDLAARLIRVKWFSPVKFFFWSWTRVLCNKK